MCATLSEKTEALETENGRLEKRIEQLLQENAEQSKRVRTKYICLTSLTRAKLNDKMAFPA